MTKDEFTETEPAQADIEKSYGPIGSMKAPPPEVIAARQKPQFIIDPKEVAPTDEIRVRRWAAEVVGKHESKFDKDWKDHQIIASGTLEPEDIDIKNIYPFLDLHWVIYKKNKLYNILLLGGSPVKGGGKEVVLCKVAFAWLKK